MGYDRYTKNTVMFTMRLTYEEFDGLEAYCKEAKISKGEAIREAVDDLLEAKRKSKALPATTQRDLAISRAISRAKGEHCVVIIPCSPQDVKIF